MEAYYNEFDPYAAQWLRNLIDAGHIAKGEVDDRSITDVKPDDLKGFTQCHFFAGIGGWSLAARLAGWPDDRPLWTGSCPCQPFSVAGKGKGQNDERHLWPVFFDLIKGCKPKTVFGEQVSSSEVVGTEQEIAFTIAVRDGRIADANKLAKKLVRSSSFNFHSRWIDGVFTDLEGIGYATGSAVVPACAVNAPHRRDRLWFVGYTEHDGQPATSKHRGDVETIQHNTQGTNCTSESKRTGSFWDVSDSINCPDGKARRIEPRIPLLVDGLPSRMAGRSPLSDSKRRKGVLSGFGNSIVPQVAAEIIKAYMECKP